MDWILVFTLMWATPEGGIKTMTQRIERLPEVGCKSMLKQVRERQVIEGGRLVVSDCVTNEAAAR